MADSSAFFELVLLGHRPFRQRYSALGVEPVGTIPGNVLAPDVLAFAFLLLCARENPRRYFRFDEFHGDLF